MTKYFISNNPEKLQEALAGFDCFATVEAEFGDELVEGSSAELTLAHHGSRSNNPPPCLGEAINANAQRVEAVGLSHVDLDACGGCLRLAGEDNTGPFWAMAAQVDVKGVHRLPEVLMAVSEDFAVGTTRKEKHAQQQRMWRASQQLQAFWAWSEEHRFFAPRDGSVADCTEFVQSALSVIARILAGDNRLLLAGRDWARSKAALESASFRRTLGGVMVREADSFTNHLYNHDGVTYAAVVGYNPARGTVTLSLADPIPGVNCCAIAQRLWGPAAGGHEGIAGSPRDVRLTAEDAEAAEIALFSAIKAAADASVAE